MRDGGKQRATGLGPWLRPSAGG